MNRASSLSALTRSGVRAIFYGALFLAPYVVGGLVAPMDGVTA